MVSLLVAVGDRKRGGAGAGCSHELCECDRKFVSCLAQFSCPTKKAMCTSPWRYFQNLFMGLGTGMVSAVFTSIMSCLYLFYLQPMAHDHPHPRNNIHGAPHRTKPKPPFKYPKPIFTDKFRANIEFGVEYPKQ